MNSAPPLPMSEPLPEPSDDEIQHLWDTRVGEPTEKYPFSQLDVLSFARAVSAARDAMWAERCAKLEADAARYRWLRDSEPNGTEIHLPGQPEDGTLWAPEELDAAIDAVLATKEPR